MKSERKRARLRRKNKEPSTLKKYNKTGKPRFRSKRVQFARSKAEDMR